MLYWVECGDFLNAKNRKIANNIFKVITNKSIASQFKNGNKKGNDQYLLSCKNL
jgi:hypothetical protein